MVGIRLFNKEIGKGGMSLESVEEILESQEGELINKIKEECI